MSVILEALKRTRSRPEHRNGPVEAQNLMNSFGFTGMPGVSRSRFSLAILLPAAILVPASLVLIYSYTRASEHPMVTAPQSSDAVRPAPPAIAQANLPESAPDVVHEPATIVSETVSFRPTRPASPSNQLLTAVPTMPVPEPPAMSPAVKETPSSVSPPSPPPMIESTNRDPYDGLLAFYAVGNYSQALQECRRALQIRPDGESTHLNCAAVHIQLGNLAEAARELAIVTSLNGRNDKAFNNLGAVHMLQGDTASAAAAFEKALLLNPANASAHLNRGLIARTSGRLEDAKKNFLSVVQLEDGNVRAHQNLAAIFEEQGEATKALLHYRRFRELALGLPGYRTDVARSETRISELETKLARH